MKKINISLIVFWVSMFILSCDPSSFTVIEVTNSSSRDLNISFITNELFDINFNMYKDEADFENFELKKDESCTFKLWSRGGYRKPNEEITQIILKDLNSGILIKEFNINDTGTFKPEKVDTGLLLGKTAYFTLTITESGGMEGYLIF